MLSRLEGEWDESEEVEFKTLFLIAALNMVLCPTQAITLACDLVPTATCALEAEHYDWSGLILEKLTKIVKAFVKRFYADAYAGGCGGCSIFLAVFYLDRLNRNPLRWGVGPRIKVWTTYAMKKACREDRFLGNGDFGKLGCVEARDGAVGEWIWADSVADELSNVSQRSRKRRRSVASNYIYERRKRKIERENTTLSEVVG